MAKVKFSALISEMRNKLNGSVFSKNRNGNYLRNKVTPVNPASAAQTVVRNRLSAVSTAWRDLGATVIAAWNSAVDNFLRTDIFGDVKRPSGKNLYARLNLNLDRIGAAHISNPPNPVAIAGIAGFSVVSDVSSSTVTLAWTSGNVPAGFTRVVEATPQLSAGKSFVKSEFRQIGTEAAATATGDNQFTNYTSRFGGLVAGKKIFVRVTDIAIATGQPGIPVEASCIITA